MNDKRGWILGVVAYGLKVPAEEFSAALAQHTYLCGKAGADTKFLPWPWEGGTLFSVCMNDQEMLDWGIYLQQFLADLCDPHEPEEGNQFLCCYGNGEGPAPADSMFTSLLVTIDDGAHWFPARDVPITTGVPKN